MKTLQKQFRFGLTVSASAVLWSLIVSAQTSEARAVLKTRLTDQRESLSKLHAELDILTMRQNQLAELRHRCSDFQKQLPATTTGDSTIASIKQLADLNTLTLAPMRLLSSKPSAGLVTRSYRLQARGSFNAFYSFLTQLEISSPSVVVSTLRLGRVSEAETDLTADLTVQLLFRGADAGQDSLAGGVQ